MIQRVACIIFVGRASGDACMVTPAGNQEDGRCRDGRDNDSRIISTGLILVNDEETQWSVLFRFGALNRVGDPIQGTV